MYQFMHAGYQELRSENHISLFDSVLCGLYCLACCVAVASTEMTVQNLEEKATLNETIERLKAQFAAVSNNLEVQTADNSQLSRCSYITRFTTQQVQLYYTLHNSAGAVILHASQLSRCSYITRFTTQQVQLYYTLLCWLYRKILLMMYRNLKKRNQKTREAVYDITEDREHWWKLVAAYVAEIS